MPSWRNKPANREYFNKRYTPRQQQLLDDAAYTATQRLYCDALSFWRHCPEKPCRRIRQCIGDSDACLKRGWDDVPQSLRDWASAEVEAGGPRRLAPANHKEWGMRRYPPSSLMSSYGPKSRRR